MLGRVEERDRGGATGEVKEPPLRPIFDRRIKLEFHGARITSDGGLLAYRERRPSTQAADRVLPSFHYQADGAVVAHDTAKLVKIGARVGLVSQ